MWVKRILDLFLVVPSIILLIPVYFTIAIWIKLDSSGPVFFRQVRVGRFGMHFRIYKFRTMNNEAESFGKQITIGDDARVTRCGKYLRKYKLDELPQLFNVLKGEMSLVGPRPEVPRYVAEYPEDIKQIVLSIPPGITDFASIEYKDENVVLGSVTNPERIYIEKILPIKLSYYVRYVNERNLWLDIKLILMTFLAVFNLTPNSQRKTEQQVASVAVAGKKNLSIDK